MCKKVKRRRVQSPTQQYFSNWSNVTFMSTNGRYGTTGCRHGRYGNVNFVGGIFGNGITGYRNGKLS